MGSRLDWPMKPYLLNPSFLSESTIPIMKGFAGLLEKCWELKTLSDVKIVLLSIGCRDHMGHLQARQGQAPDLHAICSQRERTTKPRLILGGFTAYWDQKQKGMVEKCLGFCWSTSQKTEATWIPKHPKTVYPKHRLRFKGLKSFDSFSAEARLEKINKDLQALTKQGPKAQELTKRLWTSILGTSFASRNIQLFPVWDMMSITCGIWKQRIWQIFQLVSTILSFIYIFAGMEKLSQPFWARWVKGLGSWQRGGDLFCLHFWQLRLVWETNRF